VNLFRRLIDSKHDLNRKAYELLHEATSGASGRTSRSSTADNLAQCDQTAAVLHLLVPPFRYDVWLWDAAQTRQSVHQACPAFQEKHFVAAGPEQWHNREVVIGYKDSRDVEFIVTKWANKKDAAILQFNSVKASPDIQSKSWISVRKASTCSYVERGGGAFGLWNAGTKLPEKLQEQVAARGGLWLGVNGATLRHLYLHHEPNGKKGLLRIVPHQATNQRMACITTTIAARRLVISCAATRTIWLQRAWGLLRMSLIAEVDDELQIMSRLDGFLKCLALVLNDLDFLAQETIALEMRIVDRALLHWWTLDSTKNQRGISLWAAHDHISGHFDSQHHSEVLVPEVLHPRLLGQRTA